jgi:outer membrane protein assembly factor BamA
MNLPGNARGSWFWFCLLLAAGSHLAAADEPPREMPPIIPPLEFFSRKPPLPDLLLHDKREGRYITGFPAIGYDDATKFNYGVALQFYDDGPRDSPFFRYTPYRRKIAVLTVDSTGGRRQLMADYDQPYVADTPWRLSAHVNLINNERENYFGVADEGLAALRFPGSNQTYDTYSEYQDALKQVTNGTTYSRYSVYHRTDYTGQANVEYDLMGGRLRPLLGLEVRHVRVADYSGQTLDGAVQQNTHLHDDDASGIISGIRGGWDNAVRFGFTYDTRDFEPDPQSGTTLQATGRYSSSAFRSEFNYLQFTLSARGYHTVLDGARPLVAAGRFLYSAQFGSVPFYSLVLLPLSDGDRHGLGGWETMRGFSENRFVGRAAMLTNGELRWTFAEKIVFGQHLRFTAAPFADFGRSFEDVASTTLKGWKLSGGAGLRLAWNLSTVLSFDLGASSEGSFFSMEIGSQF